MMKHHAKVVDALLTHACPSIQYRIRTEILGESKRSAPCKALQRAIQKDPLVQEAFTYRRPDGSDIDQRRSLATATRIFHEKALDPSYGPLKSIVETLTYDRCGPSIRARRIIGGPGEQAASQVSIMRSYFGLDMTAEDKLAQSQSVELFADVADLADLDDVLSHNKTGDVFKKEFLWPDMYDIDVVGLGRAWRTPESMEMMARAIGRMVELFPLPRDVKGKYYNPRKNTWSNYSIAYCQIPPSLPASPGAWSRGWFKVFEQLSRMPFLLKVPAIENVVGQLSDKLAENKGWFTEPVGARSWNFWRCYSGLALEEANFLKYPYEWVSEEGRTFDTTFRCLLILHNFGVL